MNSTVAGCGLRPSTGGGLPKATQCRRALPAVIEVPHDTTRTVTSLLLSGNAGAAARYQVAVLACRLAGRYRRAGGADRCSTAGSAAAAGFAPDGIMAELRRLHYERPRTPPACCLMAALTRLKAGDADLSLWLRLSVFSAQSDRNAGGTRICLPQTCRRSKAEMWGG